MQNFFVAGIKVLCHTPYLQPFTEAAYGGGFGVLNFKNPTLVWLYPRKMRGDQQGYPIAIDTGQYIKARADVVILDSILDNDTTAGDIGVAVGNGDLLARLNIGGFPIDGLYLESITVINIRAGTQISIANIIPILVMC